MKNDPAKDITKIHTMMVQPSGRKPSLIKVALSNPDATTNNNILNDFLTSGSIIASNRE